MGDASRPLFARAFAFDPVRRFERLQRHSQLFPDCRFRAKPNITVAVQVSTRVPVLAVPLRRSLNATITSHQVHRMPRTRKPQVSSRKQPQQARSTELVAAILEAATQVLAKQGATRFTTARVAEKAGVSVGSVYQYFPNKAAILFQLQADEWKRTAAMLKRILEDQHSPPLTRLRTLVHVFVSSECEEAPVRVALNDCAPLYRDAPEALEVRASADKTVEAYMKEALPRASAKTRALACDLVTSTMGAVGSSFSAVPRTQAEIRSYSDALADMFCAYLESLQRAR
jgi:AcrR family transcriptional regulator